MATTDTAKLDELRIFCLCGQKMKVSSSMFGRPGKCVACRQKIRVPRRSEIGDDCTEIYLRDHPEFLRKTAAKSKASKKSAPAPEENLHVGEASDVDDIQLGDETEDLGSAVPSDVLDTLQLLCSLEDKVRRKSNDVREMAPGPRRSQEKNSIMGYKALIRNARASLDDKLRDRLHVVADQLSDTKDQIGRAALSVRVGEFDYLTYQRHVTTLRQRRDRLARRRENLAGWLHTQDPYLAGGLMEVSFDDIPVEVGDVTFPLEEVNTDAPINIWVRELREAMTWREGADRKVREVRRMKRENALPDSGLGDPELEEQASASRARALVNFCRERLTLLTKDLDDDNKAIKAHLEHIRSRVESGELGKSAYENLEVELLQAESDNNRARALAGRALNANSVQDVPQPSGTLVERMGAPVNATQRGWGLDSWVAWVAAAVLLVNIFAPIATGQTMSTMVLMPTMVFGLFVSATLLFLAGAVPFRVARGVLLNVIWVVTALYMAYTINETRFWVGPAGAALRSDPLWFTAPGILLLLLGALVMGLAASVSLVNVPGWRRLPRWSALLVATGMVFFLSNYGGAGIARPYLEEPANKPSEEDPSRYASIITLRNDGWRPLWLGERYPRVPAPVTFLLERRIGADSWQDPLIPDQYLEQEGQWITASGDVFPNITIAPGASVRFRYLLEDGTYKAQVIAPPAVGFDHAERTMTLAPLAEALAVPATEVDAPPRDPENDPVIEADPVVADATQEYARTVELRGTMNSAQRTPRFVIVVVDGQGRESKLHVDLGSDIVDGWRAEEYNPSTQTLTLANEGAILVLRAGEQIILP